MNNVNDIEPVSVNSVMQGILTKLRKVASGDSSILLIGETGAGKEVLADFIFRNSKRKNKQFVKVGLATIPSDLIESELFGHEKGAFTGAVEAKKGLFELADKGTIFLDDIDDFPLNLQAKLLRVLESNELLRVGGQKPIAIDVRVISATKVDLYKIVKKGTFRADLFYRLNVVPINIPPLRERRDDIPALVYRFINEFSVDSNIELTDDALELLMTYKWPGNVRELRNLIHRIMLFTKDKITPESLPPEIKDYNPVGEVLHACHQCFIQKKMTMDEVVNCLEEHLISEALQRSNGNQSQAANYLGINRSRLRDKMKKFNLA